MMFVTLSTLTWVIQRLHEVVVIMAIAGPRILLLRHLLDHVTTLTLLNHIYALSLSGYILYNSQISMCH